MRAKHIYHNRRFVFVLSLFVCLVVAACSSASVSPTQVTRTAGVPKFAAKLQPQLEAKMKEMQTPGAIIFVDDPGQGYHYSDTNYILPGMITRATLAVTGRKGGYRLPRRFLAHNSRDTWTFLACCFILTIW